MQTVFLAALWLALWQAPPDLDNHLARGYSLLDQGRLEEAHREFSVAVAAAPKYDLPPFGRGFNWVHLSAKGSYSKAALAGCPKT